MPPTNTVVAQTRLLLPFFVIIALYSIAFSDGIAFLAQKWLDFDHGAYNHGFLLSAVAIFLIYKSVDLQKNISSDGTSLGFVVSLGLLLFAFLAAAINLASLQVLAMYFAVVSLILMLYGKSVAISTLLPIGIVLFAIPVWDEFGGFLQAVTHTMSFYMVKLTGIPVLQENYFIIVPAGRFEVESSCSGVSYFLAAAPLAIIYATTQYRLQKNQLVVVIAIIAASIIANWIRVLIIIVAGQMTNMETSLVRDHFNLGWIIFGVMFIFLVLIFNRVLTEEQNNNLEKERVHVDPSFGRVKVYISVVALLGIIFVGYKLVMQSDEISRDVTQYSAYFDIPAEFSKARSTSLNLGQTTPGAIESYYVFGDIEMYVGLAPRQSQKSEVVSYNSRFFDKKRWTVIDKQLVDTSEATTLQYKLRSKIMDREITMLAWYRANGKNTSSKGMAKFQELVGYLKGDNSGALVTLSTPASDVNDTKLWNVYNKINQ